VGNRPRSHHQCGELGHPLLVLGAKALRRRAEAAGGLAQRLPVNQQSAESVSGFQPGDLLANQRVASVAAFKGPLVQRPVGHKPIDTTPLVFQLTHRLLERVALNPDQVIDRHPHIGEEHLTEMGIGGHVQHRPHLDARRVHRHNDLADTAVWRALRGGPTDQVAVIGYRGEAGPDLLPGDHPVLTLPPGRCGQGGQVRTRIRLGHPDAPGDFTRQHAGQEPRLLRGRAVGDEGRPNLSIGEPTGGDRGTNADHFLGHHDALDRWSASAAVPGRPGHADPALGGEGP